MAWNDAVVTNEGIKLYREALTSKGITITAAIGGGSTYPTVSLINQTNITEPRINLSISSITDVDDGKQVNIRVTNVGLASSYMLRQIGLFAKNEDMTEGKLLAIMQDARGEEIPSESDNPEFVLEFGMILPFANVNEMQFQIEPSILATMGDVTNYYIQSTEYTDTKIGDAAERLEEDISAKANSSDLVNHIANSIPHITSEERTAWNAKPATDTKNTTGSTDSSSKLFLVGATSQAANPQTYSHDTVYAGTDGHLYSDSKQVVNVSGTQTLTNKTYSAATVTDGLTVTGETTLNNNLTVAGVITVNNAVSAARVASGYDAGVPGGMSCVNWFRSHGATGWCNATYGGGIYMADANYIRTYGNKNFYCSAQIKGATMACDGAFSASTASVGTISADTLTVSGRLSTPYSYISADSGIIASYVVSQSSVTPSADSTSGMTLGTSSKKWYAIYARTTTITTSDRNKKKNIYEFTPEYEHFFEKLKPITYMMKEGDRTHFGFISQDVELALEENGMSALDFGGFCKDVRTTSVTETVKETVIERVMDEDGNEVEVEKEIEREVEREEIVYDENGNEIIDYSLRYEEFISLNTHMIQKLIKKVEEQDKEIKRLKADNMELKASVEKILQRLES